MKPRWIHGGALALLTASAACDPVAIPVATRVPVEAEPAPIPPLEATDHLGRPVSIDAALERGPVALVFYRGFW